ncbi:hypothetical protein [Lactovum odontotermitis]
MNTLKKVTSSYFFGRVLATRSFWIVEAFLIAVMAADFFRQINRGDVLSGYASTFLAGWISFSGHLTWVVVLLVLPIYLYGAVVKNFIEDQKSGEQLLVISRIGRSRYILKTYGSTFIFGFVVLFFPLLTNLLLVKLTLPFLPNNMIRTFWEAFGNTVGMVKKEEDMQFVVWQMAHGGLAWLLYNTLAGIFSGLVAVSMMTLARFFRKSYQVLSLSILLYYLGVSYKDNILASKGIHPLLPVLFSDWWHNIALVFGVLLAFNLVMHWYLSGEEELIEA